MIVVPGGENADNTGTSASMGIATRFNLDINEYEYWCVPKLHQLWLPENKELVIEMHYLEEPIGTMIRELMEETGMKVRQTKDLGYRQRPHHEKVAGVHLQHAYWIYDYDDTNIHKNPPSDGKTGIPLWIPQSMIRHHLWEGHHWILDLVQEAMKKEPQLIKRFAFRKKYEPTAA